MSDYEHGGDAVIRFLALESRDEPGPFFIAIVSGFSTDLSNPVNLATGHFPAPGVRAVLGCAGVARSGRQPSKTGC
jgi:hypothetical protein